MNQILLRIALGLLLSGRGESQRVTFRVNVTLKVLPIVQSGEPGRTRTAMLRNLLQGGLSASTQKTEFPISV